MPTVPGAVGKALPAELQAAVARLTEINSLPEITAKIVEVVEDPSATARDMHDIIRCDPALAAKILKVVNSAFYGLPCQIASLDRAILMLGLSAVKNIALAASLARMFNVGAISEQFAARDLWRHSVAVAVCARSLADAGGVAPPDEAFVAGLVHDLGLIVTQQLFPGKLRQVVQRCLCSSADFCALEESIVGADHQAFGDALGARWRFPAKLRQAMAGHHCPSALGADFRAVGTLIFVADTLCGQQRHGFWLSTQNQEISEALLELVGLAPAQLDPVVDELPERIDEAEQIFAG